MSRTIFAALCAVALAAVTIGFVIGATYSDTEKASDLKSPAEVGAVLRPAFDKVSVGMTEDEARNAVMASCDMREVSCHRRDQKDGTLMLQYIWISNDLNKKEYGIVCEELDVHLNADGLVPKGGIGYVGNYLVGEKRESRQLVLDK